MARVTEIWPSREKVASEQGLSQAKLRELILRRWNDVLSADEKTYIRTSAEFDKIAYHYGEMQRVRFTVSEVLTGRPPKEIFTNVASCGYRFELNRDYLMMVYADGMRLHTGACTRMAPVEAAGEDLKALRAWKSGTPLAPRIYGRISEGELRAETILRLYGSG